MEITREQFKLFQDAILAITDIKAENEKLRKRIEELEKPKHVYQISDYEKSHPWLIGK